MNTINLKSKFDELYFKALSCELVPNKIHPVRVIQSAKSIVGINPEFPLVNLMSFCNSYIDKFKVSSLDLKFKTVESPEVITFADFEVALKSRNADRSLNAAYNLSKVSDGRHILEFLIEFSLKYKLASFPSIWSVYKMMLFLKGKDIEKNILFCIHLVINDSSRTSLRINKLLDIDFERYQYDKNNLYLFFIYYSILDEDLVRIGNITKYIKNNLIDSFSFKNNDAGANIINDQQSLGRLWISQYLEKMNIEDLNANIIITFESFRAALKSSNGIYDKMIWTNLNKYLNQNDFR